eukprot:gene30608-39433_t
MNTTKYMAWAGVDAIASSSIIDTNDFLLDSLLENKPLTVSYVRPKVVDSVNGTWLDVFGQNFVSHTVCIIGNNTEVPTVYLTSTMLKCFVPPPSLFQELSLITLRTKNTKSMGVSSSSSFAAVWYDVMYQTVFHGEKTTAAAVDMSSIGVADVAAELSSSTARHSFVCLLKDGCEWAGHSSSVVSTLDGSPQIPLSYRFEGSQQNARNTTRPAQNLTSSANATTMTTTVSSLRPMSQIFVVDPQDISLPCDDCFLQAIGSFMKQDGPFALHIIGYNDSRPCQTSVYNEDSELYCSLPQDLHPGTVNVSIVTANKVALFTTAVHMTLNNAQNHGWSYRREDRFERLRPVVAS